MHTSLHSSHAPTQATLHTLYSDCIQLFMFLCTVFASFLNKSMVSEVTMTDPPLLIASPSLYPPPYAPSPTSSPSPCLLPLLWESGTLGLQLYSLRTRVISEALRFHRWPMWTLVVQRGVMVGCPRQLKANLEHRGGAYVRIAVVGAQGRGTGKEGETEGAHLP